MSCKSGYSIEIERKFLVKKKHPIFEKGTHIEQSYLSYAENKEIRVRISKNTCKLTIKIGKNTISREEFEYNIPLDDGIRLMHTCELQKPIKKIRYKYKFEGYTWEIDFFEGDNEGLILAEVEVESEKSSIIKPDWIGHEVTNDSKYYNVNIFKSPYKNWKKNTTKI